MQIYRFMQKLQSHISTFLPPNHARISIIYKIGKILHTAYRLISEPLTLSDITN